MWLELIGLPGVGKTTLIENNLRFIESEFKILESSAPTLIQRGTAKTLYGLGYRKEVSDQKLAKKIAYRDSFRFFLSRNERIFFYDSGLMQVLLEYFIEENEPDIQMLKRVTELVTLPSAIILLKDDVKKIVEREYSRRPRRFKMNKLELIQRYQSAENFIETFLFQRIQNTHNIVASSKSGSEFQQILKKKCGFS